MSDRDLWEENKPQTSNSQAESLLSFQDFFTWELHRIDRNIDWLTNLIDKSYLPDDPIGDGERALLNIQQHHRHIAETIASASDDFATALALCRARLKSLECTRHWLAQNNQAARLLRSNQWWDIQDEMDYLADLTTRIKYISHPQ
ncbi:MAG TPA: hypothetical protein VHL11_07460 [Phototrophicaceae bacterium]|jgi:hypothetical protein|nr:hypothetical protein [Phototrophicaceae bacterium]